MKVAATISPCILVSHKQILSLDNRHNNLKYYPEIDGVLVFPEKHQSK